MEKNRAAGEIRKDFTSIPEASLEYMISLASRLAKGDQGEQLALLQQALSFLKDEKYSLMDRIEDKQLLLDKTDDLLKRNIIGTEIMNLKSQLKKVEEDILKMEEEVRQIRTNPIFYPAIILSAASLSFSNILSSVPAMGSRPITFSSFRKDSIPFSFSLS